MMNDQRVAHFNEIQRQRFDEHYDRFLEPLPGDVVERMARIVAAASIAKGETVLDVGTGTGALIPLIQSCEPASVIGCDLSSKMLDQVARLHPGVERRQCDVRDLVLAGESIDVVFMNGMFGNIADKSGALRKLRRMLRPAGRVIISHPEGRAFVARIARSEPFPITPLPGSEEARALLEEHDMSLTDYVDEERLYIVVGTRS